MKMYELLAKPEAWTQGANARTSEGEPLMSSGCSGAVSFCLIGAMAKCYDINEEEYWIASGKLDKEFDGLISTWNDAPERTHEEVLSLCKRLDI